MLPSAKSALQNLQNSERAVSRNLYVFKCSQQFLFCSSAGQPLQATVLGMEFERQFPFWVFICHGHLQFAVSEYLAYVNLRYRLYPLPTTMAIHDLVKFGDTTSSGVFRSGVGKQRSGIVLHFTNKKEVRMVIRICTCWWI